jgi:hypothetical protein
MPGSVTPLASPLRGDRPVHLCPLLLPGLSEHRQQHHPSTWSQLIAHRYLATMQVEPKLPRLAA